MRDILMVGLLIAAPGVAAAQTITNPVTNPNTTSPSTSLAVPRVGENVDDATSATEQTSRRDALTPGPTTLRDREANGAAHKHRKPRRDEPR